jgi:hypothetical protein
MKDINFLEVMIRAVEKSHQAEKPLSDKLCKNCGSLPAPEIRWMPPEALGLEPSEDDRPIKITTYHCHYWDAVRKSHYKTSIGITTKPESSCAYFCERKAIVATEKRGSDWLDIMADKRQQTKIQRQASLANFKAVKVL